MKKNKEKILFLYIASYGLYEEKNLVRHYPVRDQNKGRIKKRTISRDICWLDPPRIQLCTDHKKKRVLCLLVSPREGEILLVDLASLIDVGMQVNLGGLDRRMTKVLLHDPEIL